MFTDKRYVEFRRLNWNTTFYRDLIMGEGFVISEPPETTVDNKKKKSLYGPQSPLYGTSYEDEQAFVERYRCECGEFKGKLFEGRICPLCQKKVEFKDTNIKMTGWIDLGLNNYIVNPYYFNVLQKAIGTSVFPDIVYAKYKVTKNGIREKIKEEDLDDKPSSPYYGIGVDEFIVRYEEILNYFKSVKKNKNHTIDKLIEEKDAVFVSKIPVISTFLRPSSSTTDTYYYHTVDKLVNTLFTLSESLKSCAEIERDHILQRIQKKANDIWNQLFNTLNTKEGWIRGNLLGGSINYSSRNVIVPSPDLKNSEIDISYQTFLELFKYKIIYYLMKLEDISLSKAYYLWKKASTFNETVYRVMEFILKYGDTKVLINRNPTLNYYSLLLMNIRKVKPDDSDLTLSVPLSILPGLNADFDGDILNIIGIPCKEIAYLFRKYDPVRRMVISRDSGLLNEYFAITKGQLIDLYNFCNLSPSDCDTEELWPDENGNYVYTKEQMTNMKK